MSETKYYYLSQSGTMTDTGSLKEARSRLKKGGYIWLDFYDPLKEELAVLTDSLGIHPLSIEDCLDEKQIPKIEYFDHNTFILFNSFTYSDRILFIDEIDLIIGKNYLVTVSGHNSGSRRPLDDMAGLIKKGQARAFIGPDMLMHLILDYIVDEKYKAFDDMEDELAEAEEKLIDNVESFRPVQLIQLRKNLMVMRKSLFHEREILLKLVRQDDQFISDQVVAHYRDIYDHLTKFFELTETFREIETSLMELYSSLLNNRMTQMSNDTNTSVRRLTMIATIFMPLTLISGILGMSEFTMMTGPTNWKIAYPLFILGMIITGLINYLVIKRFEKKK